MKTGSLKQRLFKAGWFVDLFHSSLARGSYWAKYQPYRFSESWAGTGLKKPKHLKILQLIVFKNIFLYIRAHAHTHSHTPPLLPAPGWSALPRPRSQARLEGSSGVWRGTGPSTACFQLLNSLPSEESHAHRAVEPLAPGLDPCTEHWGHHNLPSLIQQESHVLQLRF